MLLTLTHNTERNIYAIACGQSIRRLQNLGCALLDSFDSVRLRLTKPGFVTNRIQDTLDSEQPECRINWLKDNLDLTQLGIRTSLF